MQLSRAVRCGRLCWRNTSPPPPRLCMSLAAQTWRIVHRWELIIRFLLLLIFQLVFPPRPAGRSLPRSPLFWQLADTEPPSPPLCLPSSLMVIDGTRRLWGFLMNDGYYLSGRKRRHGVRCKWQCTVDGRMTSCGRLSVIFQPHSSLKDCVCLLHYTSNSGLPAQQQMWHWSLCGVLKAACVHPCIFSLSDISSDKVVMNL